MPASPIRVAVVGGGCAAMAAAFSLTKPGRVGRRCEVTVYQMGHRLGGKGASGRGVSGRIEEHGLHLWMGYYENAFRLMRECYEELDRDPKVCPIARWSDAFAPANLSAVADWSPSGRWQPWIVNFPPAPGLPGDPRPRLWTVPEYLSRLAALAGALLRTLQVDRREATPRSELFPELGDSGVTGYVLVQGAERLLKYCATAGLGVLVEAMSLLERALARMLSLPQSPIVKFVDAIASALRKGLESLLQRDDEARRLWEVLDLVLAAIKGSIIDRLAFHPHGFDAIDEYDSRDWLLDNGASKSSVNSAFIRGLYDLAFAYEGGNPKDAKIAAGAALRGAMRAFFTYRGAFFWKMNAGMGDIVFAPLYEVLKRRGVRFEFFHKLTNVALGKEGKSTHVSGLEFDVQALVKDGREYRPLVDVGGLPSWPAAPDFSQLVEGKRLRSEGWDLESQWDTRRARSRTLRVGKDFDVVVLAVGMGVVPYVCRELVECDERFRAMVDHVKTVPTQAFQLWLRTDMANLGWNRPVNLSGFVEPFDTWADMTHVVRREAWNEPPRSIAYFCNVLPDESEPGIQSSVEEAAAFVKRRKEQVRDNAIRFMNRDLCHIWSGAHRPDGSFDFRLLHAERPTEDGHAAFDTQYWTANVRPSDRYTQSLPKSSPHRISPLDEKYDNLTLAGDWTSCGLNTGCVEAAVMSGLLASHAITKFPALSDIVGYDHP